MRIAVFGSGGGTKLPFLLTSVYTIMEYFGIRVVAYGGSSAGAITAFAAALGKTKEMRHYAYNLKFKDFTSLNLSSKLGQIKSYYNFLFKGYFFDLKNLENTISHIVSEEEFQRWRKRDFTPNCFVCTVNVNEPEPILYNLKKCDTLSGAIDIIKASSSVMPINPAVEVMGPEADGGHWYHNPAPLYARDYSRDFDKIITIYTRPQINVTDDGEDGDPMRYTYKKKKGLRNLMRAIEIQSIRGSIADEKELDSILPSSKIIKVFAPEKLTGEMHEIKKGQNKKISDMGIKEARKVIDYLNGLIKF